MILTYLGQSCFHLQTGDYSLLFDPMIKGNPLASEVSLEEIHCDYILLSHGHGDHSGDVEEIARRCGAVVVSCFETVAWFEKKGIKGHSMNIGGKWQFPFGVVKQVSAVHSSELPDGTYAGQASGFVLWNDEGCIYFAGDTALTMDMQLIPLTCPPLDAAILPMGDNYTMGCDDALLAASFVKCNHIIGCHFDTFEIIRLDHQRAKAIFKNDERELILPAVGQKIEI